MTRRSFAWTLEGRGGRILGRRRGWWVTVGRLRFSVWWMDS